MSDIKDEKEAHLQQLMAGKKPFACITYWHDQKEAAVLEAQRTARFGWSGDGFAEAALPGYQFDHVWDVLACHDIRVQDIGDLRALSE